MKLKTAIPSIAAALLAAAPLASAQNATTAPVGFVTTNITASSNGVAYAFTPVSPVLLALSSVNGSVSGIVSSVGSNNITVSSAGWSDNQLSSNFAYILFQSGALQGLMLRVTANTATELILDTLQADLVTLGAASGDSFQLVQGDTILSMFGTTSDGVVGGNQTQFNAGQTDRLQVRDTGGVVRTYYYNTDFNQWRRFGSSADQGTTPIAPTSGMLYSRISQTPLSVLTTGNVPVTAVKYLVPPSGTAYFARYFPTSGTINDFGFQNLPGWTSSDRVSTTDSGGVVRNYTWNGSQWRRFGSSADQGATAVPVGGAVSVTRFGTAGPAQLLSVSIPYQL
jgi:hypothetical protein